MTATRDIKSALYPALAYHGAWTSHHLHQAMTYIDPNIVCDTPSGKVIGIDDFRAFLGPISRNLTRSELISANGDRNTAILIYDTDTIHVQHAPVVEYLTVHGGRITTMRVVFHRASVDAATPGG